MAYSYFRTLGITFCAWLALVIPSVGVADGSNPAKIDLGSSRIADAGSAVELSLLLSEAVPWRAFALDAPQRIVLDFAEVDFREVDLSDIAQSGAIAHVEQGEFRPGWSRAVIWLTEPLRIDSAAMASVDADEDGTGARLDLILKPTTGADFAALASDPPDSLLSAPKAAEIVATTVSNRDGLRPLRILLHTGSTGLNPDDEHGIRQASHLIPSIAQDLAAALRADGHRVTMAGQDDLILPLDGRQALAIEAESDLLLSLHADGSANVAASVYPFGHAARDTVSQPSAEWHDPAGRLEGGRPAWQDTDGAPVSTEPTQAETLARSERLADLLLMSLPPRAVDQHENSPLQTDFFILKGSEIPSVLIEFGLLSDREDDAGLADPDWRVRTIESIRTAVAEWATAGAPVATHTGQ